MMMMMMMTATSYSTVTMVLHFSHYFRHIAIYVRCSYVTKFDAIYGICSISGRHVVGHDCMYCTRKIIVMD